MNQITCPKCGTVINLDESDYEGIVRQVRDDQFAHEVEERAASLRREHELARSQAKAELDRVMAAQKAELQEALARSSAELQEVKARSASELQEARAASAAALQQAQSAGAAQLAKEQNERAAELMRVRAEADARIAELSAKLESAVEERESAVRVAAQRERMVAQQDAADQKEELREQLAARDAQIASLKAQLDAGATQRDLAVTQAVTEARTTFEEERAKLARDLDAARFELSHEQEVRAAEKQQIETAHALEIEQARKSAQDLIRYKDEEIERLRDMKARLSTKMVGETLEQHCETQFNQLRATAFPHAYFEKDNDASDGTKGDFIFRECDEAGNEIVSIMFEMKNENDTTATKHKNEDFFKKLDSDAVLVTLLEPESELYNTGIVDVSYRYEKMYVIRPQFFIPMITLLRNAAMNALAYKQELELVRQQNIDVTEFEEKLPQLRPGKPQVPDGYRRDRHHHQAPAEGQGQPDLEREQPASGERQGPGAQHPQAYLGQQNHEGEVRRGSRGGGTRCPRGRHRRGGIGRRARSCG